MKFLGCFFLFFLLFTPLLVYGDHGSGGGGGCSGDCIPPTMGFNENDRLAISGGFTINGESYDVDFFQQSIPTQVSQVGEPVEISLLIHENSGAFYLGYVELLLGQTDEFVSGQLIPTSPVQIVWEKTLDGKESFFVIDENNLIVDVTVDSFVDGIPEQDTVTKLTFSFVPTGVFNSNPIVVAMWDHNRSSWKNYFYDALIIDEKIADIPSDIKFSKDNDLIVPSWIKNTAGFWANNQIDDSTFVSSIQYCIENNIIQISDLPTFAPDDVFHFVDISKGPQHYVDRYYSEPSYKEWFDTNFPDNTIEEAVGLDAANSQKIPDWIKNNAKWWSEDQLDDITFVNGIKFLIETGILIV